MRAHPFTIARAAGWPALVLLTSLFGASAAFALPNTVTVTDTDRDAVLTLTTWDQAITEDARSRCTVRIQAGSGEIDFTAGDTIVIRVFEDDALGNDLLFQADFTITPAELRAGAVDRTFDCSTNFGTDGVGGTEIFAEADVNKDECGFFCNLEEPQTGNIDIAEVDDDGEEPDDDPSAANNLGIGLTRGRIGRDQDWVFVNIDPTPANLSFTLVHEPAFGRLEVALFDTNDRRIADGVDNPGDTALLAPRLAVGTYRLRISPQQSNDFNFYDMRLIVEPAMVQCTPGVEESEACGSCGTRTRRCGNDGNFGPFGTCGGEGECAPGDERAAVCGNCGTQTEVCDDACGWTPGGSCMGEGECARGAVEALVCEGGNQTRVCSDACTWGAFSACLGDECQDGQEQPCYDGPQGTEGVGACAPGRQFCQMGRFGDCQAQVTPAPEQCADGRDNDCDGEADEADEDCAEEGAEIGSACLEDGECAGALICLSPPEHAAFVGGYCGDEDCVQDDDCGADGVCGEVFGRSFCLRICQGAPDCRRGYRCASVGGDEDACVPGCASAADCTDPTRPICDPDTNLCVAGPDPNPEPEPEANPEPDANPEPNPTPEPEMGPDLDVDGGTPATPQGGGCCTIPPANPPRTPWAPIALALIVGALIAGRRREDL